MAILWFADHSTGDLSQWNSDTYGGAFDNAPAESSIQTDPTGDRGSVVRTRTPGGGLGARMFRWRDSAANQFTGEIFCSAWSYIPSGYTAAQLGNFWNIFQFKSKEPSNAYNNPSGVLAVYSDMRGLYWRDYANGPEFTRVLNAHTLPLDQWIHIQVGCLIRADGTGRLRIWLNEVVLGDFQNINTKLAAADEHQVSWNSYSDGTGADLDHFVDDAIIADTYQAMDSVTWVAPLAGATVDGTINLEVDVEGSATEVRFYADGVLIP